MPMKNPPHPGLSVRLNCLEPFGLSVTEGAKALGVSRTTLSRLINGQSGVSPDMAIRVHSTRQAAYQIQADARRRGRAPAPRIRLRQHVRFRPIPAPRRLPQRRSRGLPGGLPVAPPPRHRDHHLRPGRNRRAWRQHGQPGRHRGRRRPVDDGRQRHHPPGNAQGRPERAACTASSCGPIFRPR
jgi:addiction module HigA family antidote